MTISSDSSSFYPIAENKAAIFTLIPKGREGDPLYKDIANPPSSLSKGIHAGAEQLQAWLQPDHFGKVFFVCIIGTLLLTAALTDPDRSGPTVAFNEGIKRNPAEVFGKQYVKSYKAQHPDDPDALSLRFYNATFDAGLSLMWVLAKTVFFAALEIGGLGAIADHITNKNCTMHLTEKAFTECVRDKAHLDDLKDPLTLELPTNPVVFLGDRTVTIFDRSSAEKLLAQKHGAEHPVTKAHISDDTLVDLPELKAQIQLLKKQWEES